MHVNPYDPTTFVIDPAVFAYGCGILLAVGFIIGWFRGAASMAEETKLMLSRLPKPRLPK